MNDQRRFARYLLEQMEECIEDECVDSVACLLDNLANCNLKLVRDSENTASAAYMEELKEMAKQ